MKRFARREKGKKRYWLYYVLNSVLMVSTGIIVGIIITLHYPQLFPSTETVTDSNITSSITEQDGQVKSIEAEQSDQSATVYDSSEGLAEHGEIELSPVQEEKTVTEKAEKILTSMTLREKIYQMFIVTQEQLTGASHVVCSGDATKTAILSRPVGGIIYFEDNIISPEQCTSMISSIQSYSNLGLFIAVDEEGGRVARLGNNETMNTTSFPDMGTIGSTGNVESAYEVGKTIGNDIAQYGFNLDFAPVADVNSNPDNPVIGERAFGSNADTVAEMVSSAVKGFHDSRILCTLKHYPGHGDTSTDSHKGYAEVPKTLDELRELEFKPFQAGIKAGADAVMVGHLAVPQVTGDQTPATLSKEMVDLLKNELNFKGLIITDSMSMGAITDNYSSSEAAIKAVQAGNDLILMPADLESAADGIESAVADGRITEERIDASVQKILEKKIIDGIISFQG